MAPWKAHEAPECSCAGNSGQDTLTCALAKETLHTLHASTYTLRTSLCSRCGVHPAVPQDVGQQPVFRHPAEPGALPVLRLCFQQLRSLHGPQLGAQAGLQ